MFDALPDPLVCSSCRVLLRDGTDGLTCPSCGYCERYLEVRRPNAADDLPGIRGG